MMRYRGFKAQIDFDDGADRFFGGVINTRDGIAFSGRSVEELRRDFARAVEEHLSRTGASTSKHPEPA